MEAETQTAQRLKFAGEVEAIRRQHGGLEQMRVRLGLSRRRVCEYLMVDPSAWSRWVTEKAGQREETAPPHVYKTMALLLDKFAEDPVAFMTPAVPTQVSLDTLKKLEIQWREDLQSYQQELRSEFLAQLESVKSASQKTEELTLGWKFLLLINFLLVLYVIFR